jgi:hypothetical protein
LNYTSSIFTFIWINLGLLLPISIESIVSITPFGIYYHPVTQEATYRPNVNLIFKGSPYVVFPTNCQIEEIDTSIFMFTHNITLLSNEDPRIEYSIKGDFDNLLFNKEMINFEKGDTIGILKEIDPGQYAVSLELRLNEIPQNLELYHPTLNFMRFILGQE